MKRHAAVWIFLHWLSPKPTGPTQIIAPQRHVDTESNDEATIDCETDMNQRVPAALGRDVQGQDLGNERRGSRGLRWHNLGVSLEPCPTDVKKTYQAHQKYLNNSISNDAEMDDVDDQYFFCLDNSLWLLHPTSGFVEDGSLCGIIGPSGSGKTTFLNALGGTTPRNAGVYLSGSVWYEEQFIFEEETKKDIKKDTGEVMQKDSDLDYNWEDDELPMELGDGWKGYNPLSGEEDNDKSWHPHRPHAPHIEMQSQKEEISKQPDEETSGEVVAEKKEQAQSQHNTKYHYKRYHLSQQKGDIAMLSQHDNFFEMLTPRESLELSAYLELEKQKVKNVGNNKFDGQSQTINHRELAEHTLASLGLLGVADHRIGDRTKIGNGNGGGGLGIFGWAKIRHWARHSREAGRRADYRSSTQRATFKPRRQKVASGGGLSGGERRRLSVAMELITEPKIFLADEPTTGLDSAQAEKVVKLIAKLAKERNVPSICTLHQPKTSIWKTLDSFVLLAPGGKMCYSGDRQNATSYFRDIGFDCPPDTNPAEYFIDLVTIDTEDPAQALVDNARIDFIHHKFLESLLSSSNIVNFESSCHSESLTKKQKQQLTHSKENNSANEKSINTTKSGKMSLLIKILQNKLNHISRIARRFGALLQRSWRQNARNFRVNLLRLSSSVTQALLFASIFKSVRDDKSLTKSLADRIALLTFGVINMSIMAIMKTLDLFARERSVVTREQMRNNYSSLEYLLAKVVSEMPLDTSFAIVFAAALKKLTGLRTSLWTLAKTYSLMTVSSVALGFAVGSVSSSVETAMGLGVPVMVIFMVVGVINPSGVSSDETSNMLMQFLKLASPIKWAVEALVVAEFRDMDFGEKDHKRCKLFDFFSQMEHLKDLPKMGAVAMVKSGNEVLDNLGLGNAEYSDIMLHLASLSGIYLFMSWLGLTFFGVKFMEPTEPKS